MEKAVAMYIRILLEDEDMPDGKAESSSVTNQRNLLGGIFLEKKNLQEGQPMQSGEDSEEDGRGDAGESCEIAGSDAC